jgi:hypothetical protein
MVKFLGNKKHLTSKYTHIYTNITQFILKSQSYLLMAFSPISSTPVATVLGHKSANGMKYVPKSRLAKAKEKL